MAKINAAVESIVKSLQAKFGEENITYLGNNNVVAIERISSGSFSLDNALGGGWPVGRIIEIMGPESSGKTSICYHAMAEAQKLGWVVALVDTEYSHDPVYSGNIGVDNNSLIVSQPEDGTQALDILIQMLDAGVKLAVVDSVASLLPREEAESDDFGKATVGRQAQLMSKALRKLTPAIGRNKAIVIFTNQLRQKIGVMYGNPECVTPDTNIKVKYPHSNISVYTTDMEHLFYNLSLDYKNMDKNSFYDISRKNFEVESFNHQTGKVEFKKILKIVRKDDAFVYNLVNNNKVVLKCSGNHRIWDEDKKDYVHVQDVKNVSALNSDGLKIVLDVVKTEEVSPIVDMQVEDNSNYFTNGILSHNTTAGGESLKYYASIRCRVSTVSGSTDESKRTKVKVIKNKTAVPFKETEFNIVFGVGIDKVNDLVEGAIDCGLFTKGSGGVYTSKILTEKGVDKIRGREKLITWIKEQGEDFMNYLANEAREYVKNQRNNTDNQNISQEDDDEQNSSSGEI